MHTLAAGCALLVLGLAAGSATAQDAAPQAQDSYYLAARQALKARLVEAPRTGPAKNVILFIGDGMGVSTLTAARILAGQRLGVDGESYSLTMDTLPYTALVRTYAHDAQVSDSAPTATAMTTGVKTRNDIIGLSQHAIVDDCAGSRDKSVRTLFEMAETAGLATGVVSTARITHATPAAAYAHSANRDWENDSELPAKAKAEGCIDIARQMIEWPAGNGFEVMLGGGRAQFLTADQVDVEDPGAKGLRRDGRDLVAAWRKANPKGAYVWNAKGFDAVDPASTDKLLGLFQRDHMTYEGERAADPGGEPSLEDMTAKAIAMLQRSPQGYVLMIEAGRVDHAHHEGLAGRALEEAIALDAAVKRALAMVNLDETLVVVTADHSHGLTISGYPKRGNPILGTVQGQSGKVAKAPDGKAYTTLSYATGPGGVDGPRADPATIDTTAPGYRQPALVLSRSAAHSGEDIALRAIGPQAHLLQGTIEQNLIFHVMARALGGQVAREAQVAGAID